MKHYKLILQDNANSWKNLLPFTFTRPISHIRIGIDTILEKWEAFLNQTAEVDTEDYLMPKFQNKQPEQQNRLIVNSSIIPTKELVSKINQLKPQQTLEQDGIFIAQLTTDSALPTESIEADIDLIQIQYPWDIFMKNDQVFRFDFERITKGKISQPISETNRVINADQIFLEEGAQVEFSILNAKDAPIYIGKNATIMEGSIVKGGLALCESATLKMATKLYGTSTIGPHSKIGGEVGNIVVFGYSNKGHDGYLGNAVLGEWCNLGADTNSSNLKNNYGFVRAWNYAQEQQIDTGSQFVGLMMGDHSKCGINTMFNTATVAGVCANIFGGGFPAKHIPSFAWGAVDKTDEFKLEKAFEMAEAMMKRRKVPFTDADKEIFSHIFTSTKKYRKEI